jgi:hypothetical protein
MQVNWVCECGEVLKCPNCDISLTYHKSNNIMRCHYCGYGVVKPNKCSKCNSKDIILMGTGTEKVEEVLFTLEDGLTICLYDEEGRKSYSIKPLMLVRFENSYHTLENQTDNPIKFLIFKLLLDGIDKSGVLRVDKILYDGGDLR